MKKKLYSPPICQFCGNAIKNFAVSRHEGSCIYNPDVRALLLKWLPDPQNPSCIRTMENYKKSTPNRPGAECLADRHGSWHAVASLFGLNSPATGNDVRSERKTTATLEEFRRLSRELHGGQWSPTYWEYSVNRRSVEARDDAPLKAEVLIKKYGTWSAVLEHYQLPPVAPVRPVLRNKEQDIITCAPFWYEWRIDDDSVHVEQVNYRVFHG